MEGAVASALDWLGCETDVLGALSTVIAAGSSVDVSRAFGSTASAAMRASAEMTSVHVLPGTSREDAAPSPVWTSSLPISCSPCIDTRALKCRSAPLTTHSSRPVRART